MRHVLKSTTTNRGRRPTTKHLNELIEAAMAASRDLSCMADEAEAKGGYMRVHESLLLKHHQRLEKALASLKARHVAVLRVG